MPLDPTPTPATPATAAAAAPSVPNAGQAGAPPTDPNAPPATVTIPFDQLKQYNEAQQRLVQIEAEQRAREESARTEQLKLMAQKGDVERALSELREDSRKQVDSEKATRMAMEERVKRYAVEGELSRALSGFNLVPGGNDQLTTLFRGQLMAEARGDGFIVQTPTTYKPAKDFVAEQLGRPEYAHFLRASNPAGGTAGGASSGALAGPTSPANPAAPPVPKNFGEAIILQMQSIAKEQPSDPRMNPAAAMGLNRASTAAMVKQG